MTTASAFVLASVIALPIQSVPPNQVPRPYGYPAERPPELVERYRCFMQTADGRGLDLRSMCDGTRQRAIMNRVATPFGSNRSTGSSSSGASSGGSSSGGNCPTASSRAADGSRCGGRAASERSGGR